MDFIKQLRDAGAKEVIVLHVNDTRGIDFAALPASKDYMEIERALEEIITEEIGAIEDELKGAGFKVKVRVEKGIPFREILRVEEEEIADLRAAIAEAVVAHGIEGIVTGAVGSVYQATRVQRVCSDLGLWCFNPLWQLDQLALLDQLIEGGYRVMVTGVFAPPLDETWLGRVIDRDTRDALAALWESHGIHPAGEGGEIETTVLDAPLFGGRIEVRSSTPDYRRDSGVLHIDEAEVVDR